MYGPPPPPPSTSSNSNRRDEAGNINELNRTQTKPTRTFSSFLEEQLYTLSYDTLLNGPLRSDSYFPHSETRPMTVVI